MKRIAHLVHPVIAPERRDLHGPQQVTFEAMRNARARAEQSQEVSVELCAALFADDPAAPDGFTAAARLTRSVIERGTFSLPMRLPLLGDLVDRLHACEAELLVLSNVDIAPHPDFYLRALALAGGGLAAFSINRRTVAWQGADPPAVDWLVRQEGSPHPGHDCFLFRPGLISGADFGDLCLGLPPVGSLMVAALSTATEHFRVLEDERLTFHLNDDRAWRDPRFDDYWAHNRRAGAESLARIEARLGRLSPLALELRKSVLAIPRVMDF